MFRLLSSGLLLVLVIACGKPVPDLEGMDLQVWKEDKNACLNKRAPMQNAIRQQKEKLLALDEKKIISLLGKPDQNELYRRNQKFYSYFITPAPACDGAAATPLVLIIRFNAMGLAKEVVIE